jgi:predicted transcriptional regulator
MEIAGGITGLSLTMLGIIFGYIWKSNGEMQKTMMKSLERIEQGQERLAQIVKEGQERLAQGQERLAGIIKEGQGRLVQGQERLAEMLLTQTKILEKIENKLPPPS